MGEPGSYHSFLYAFPKGGYQVVLVPGSLLKMWEGESLVIYSHEKSCVFFQTHDQ